MTLSCFFGVALTPNVVESPPIPDKTVLCLSQVCVAADNTYGGRMTVLASGKLTKAPMAIATLHPDVGIYHCPLEHLFSEAVQFELLLESKHAAAEPARHTLKDFVCPSRSATAAATTAPSTSTAAQNEKTESGNKKKRQRETGGKASTDEAAGLLCKVHLTGFYQQDDPYWVESDEDDGNRHDDEDEDSNLDPGLFDGFGDGEEEEDDEDSDEDDDDEEEEDDDY